MTHPLTPEARAELRAKAAAATQGEWYEGHNVVESAARRPLLYAPHMPNSHDVAFAAAANPAVVRALLDQVDALEAAAASRWRNTADELPPEGPDENVSDFVAVLTGHDETPRIAWYNHAASCWHCPEEDNAPAVLAYPFWCFLPPVVAPPTNDNPANAKQP